MNLLWEKILEQLYLVSISVMTAVFIGVLLGILINRYPKFQMLVLGIVNIIQTIPSLAMLAFLLPVFGIGFKPAYIALTLYAILPIVRNTLVGLTEISTHYIEIAKDLGASAWQSLIKIELPLAMPVIISGVRIAIAMTVGIATIAAFIGAGGLGDFITRGLAMNDNRLLLMGAIPAAIMALCLDGLFVLLQKRSSHILLSKLFYIFVTIAILFIIYSGYHIYNKNTNKYSVTIGTKNFTEQYILGEITAQLIEAKTSLNVIRKFNLGTTDICMKAMQEGDIDLYPEYTGTAYMTVLHLPFQSNLTPDDLYRILKIHYAKKFNIIWLGLLGFNNSQSLVVMDEFTHRHEIQTLSDLSHISSVLTLGAPPEFLDRSDGYPVLKKYYNMEFKKIVTMEPTLAYEALINHNLDVIEAFTTDPRITKFHLKIITDNKKVLPAYQAAILINQSTLQKYPTLEKVLHLLDNQINNETMQALNAEVDIDKKSVGTVAHEFLVSKKLIQ